MIAKIVLILRAGWALGSKVFPWLAKNGPLIATLLSLIPKKKKESAEGLQEGFHHASETGDPTSLEDVTREHRRKHPRRRLRK
jgi:hypothetical protein